MLHNGFQYDLNHIIFGLKMKHGMHLPFSRYKHVLNEYGFDPTAAQTLSYKQNELERNKPFAAEIGGDIAGQSHVVPRTTNENDPHYYNNQGESIYSNPWPWNRPMIDHEIDEEDIWHFQRTVQGFSVIPNPYSLSKEDAEFISALPLFTGKFAVPQWMNKAKMDKWHRHYEYRLGLHQIQKRIAEKVQNADAEVEGIENSVGEEVSEYIDKAYTVESQYSGNGIAVTDHSFQPRQLLTTSEEEDQEYYKLMQAMAEYNSDVVQEKLSKPDRPRFEKGTLLQKILDPFQGSKVLEDGTI